MGKEASSAVKVDSYLIERIEKAIKRDENRFKFANKKQFVDIAVNQLLNSIEKKKIDK